MEIDKIQQQQNNNKDNRTNKGNNMGKHYKTIMPSGLAPYTADLSSPDPGGRPKYSILYLVIAVGPSVLVLF